MSCRVRQTVSAPLTFILLYLAPLDTAGLNSTSVFKFTSQEKRGALHMPVNTFSF